MISKVIGDTNSHIYHKVSKGLLCCKIIGLTLEEAIPSHHPWMEKRFRHRGDAWSSSLDGEALQETTEQHVLPWAELQSCGAVDLVPLDYECF